MLRHILNNIYLMTALSAFSAGCQSDSNLNITVRELGVAEDVSDVKILSGDHQLHISWKLGP